MGIHIRERPLRLHPALPTSCTTTHSIVTSPLRLLTLLPSPRLFRGALFVVRSEERCLFGSAVCCVRCMWRRCAGRGGERQRAGDRDSWNGTLYCAAEGALLVWPVLLAVRGECARRWWLCFSHLLQRSRERRGLWAWSATHMRLPRVVAVGDAPAVIVGARIAAAGGCGSSVYDPSLDDIECT